MLYVFRDKNLVIISALVFFFLNILENLIQFTIGRKKDSKILEIINPSKRDWIKIIIVTIIFAISQGILTLLFYHVKKANL